jgi:hypothetical protein
MKMPIFMPSEEIPSQNHALFFSSPVKETVHSSEKLTVVGLNSWLFR